MSILCKINLHFYNVTSIGDYDELGLTIKPSIRLCSCCGKTQELEKHCLGLNPHEYQDCWITIKK